MICSWAERRLHADRGCCCLNWIYECCVWDRPNATVSMVCVCFASIHSICSPICSLGRNSLHVYTMHNNNKRGDDEYDDETARSNWARYVLASQKTHIQNELERSTENMYEWMNAEQERWNTSFASHTAMWFVFWAITKPANKLQRRRRQQRTLQL